MGLLFSTCSELRKSTIWIAYLIDAGNTVIQNTYNIFYLERSSSGAVKSESTMSENVEDLSAAAPAAAAAPAGRQRRKRYDLNNMTEEEKKKMRSDLAAATRVGLNDVFDKYKGRPFKKKKTESPSQSAETSPKGLPKDPDNYRNREDKNNNKGVTAVKAPKYPTLNRFGIDEDELTKMGADKMKRLIGELVALQQQAQSGNKNIIQFYKLQQAKPDTAVIIRSHKSRLAFERYHFSRPYIDEVIRCMDSDEDVAVKRLSLYLAKKHGKILISAAMEAGLSLEKLRAPSGKGSGKKRGPYKKKNERENISQGATDKAL